MATDDPSEKPLGFNIDIGDILDDLTRPKRRTTRRTTRSTSRSTGTGGSGDMDAAIRRAIRAELADVERALEQLAQEVVRLRKANQELAAQVARALR